MRERKALLDEVDEGEVMDDVGSLTHREQGRPAEPADVRRERGGYAGRAQPPRGGQPSHPLMMVSRRSKPNARSVTATIGGPCRRLYTDRRIRRYAS